MLEEAGLVAHKLVLIGVFSGKDHLWTYPNGDQVSVTLVAYICCDFSGALLPQEDEVMALQWFDVDDLPTEISPPDQEPMQAFVEWARHNS